MERWNEGVMDSWIGGPENLKFRKQKAEIRTNTSIRLLWRRSFAEVGFHQFKPVFLAGDFGVVSFFLGLLGQECGGGDLGQERGNGGFGKLRFRTRVTVGSLRFDGVDLFDIFDEDRVVLLAEGAAGIVALFLGGRDFAIQAAEQVNQFGEAVEISFRII